MFVNHVDSVAARWWNQPARWGLMTLVVLLCAACGGSEPPPTRTPVPTWTPTPVGAGPAAPAEGNQQATAPNEAPPDQPPTQEAPATNTQPPPPPTATLPPTETPTPAATDTPTATPEPTPTPTPAYSFTLEMAEKFPTESLAPNVVRIYLYVYSPAELGLGGYSLQVTRNGAPLLVDEESTAGAPDVTRTEPGPFTRFTNMNVIFVEPQAGRWEIQLVDEQGQVVGPPAVFDLTADEATRELYVRYRR